ncbi:hypothetical protein [Desulfosporosinus sp. OT]|uniref:hypothetical protein n=1 Tax=Desulfosporosinus sp. OT TaxID=913865 RepID=UPI0009FC57B3|nr:hypothetical protein [Desulfosporosinus sp. OT]
MTMRQVGETVSKSELHFNFSDSGLAIEQNPVGGKVVTKGVIVEVNSHRCHLRPLHQLRLRPRNNKDQISEKPPSYQKKSRGGIKNKSFLLTG